MCALLTYFFCAFLLTLKLVHSQFVFCNLIVVYTLFQFLLFFTIGGGNRSIITGAQKGTNRESLVTVNIRALAWPLAHWQHNCFSCFTLVTRSGDNAAQTLISVFHQILILLQLLLWELQTVKHSEAGQPYNSVADFYCLLTFFSLFLSLSLLLKRWQITGQ